MNIIYREMTPETLKPRTFQRLIKHRLYTRGGAFFDRWADPTVIASRCHFSLAFQNRNPIGVAYLEQGMHYWFEPEDAESYGLLGFFVHRDYRGQGIAVRLCQTMLGKSGIQKVSGAGRAVRVIGKVAPEKFVPLRGQPA